MESDQQSFWQVTSKVQEEAGAGAALLFLILFGIYSCVMPVIAGYVISLTIGSPIWLTMASVILLKWALK